MECELTGPLAFPEPEHVGVRVEILPDLYVEVHTARRIHALVLCLLALLMVLAGSFVPGLSLRHALVSRPVLAGPLEGRRALSRAQPPRRAPHPVRWMEGFVRARKRALEVLQYAITTAPPELRASAVELSSDPADPFDPARFRLRIACAPDDPAITRGFLANLRVVLPGAGLATGEDAPGVFIDSHPPPASRRRSPRLRERRSRSRVRSPSRCFPRRPRAASSTR